MATRHIILTTFNDIPLRPFPNMIAPIYFPGRIPPKAKVDDYTIPPKTPKTTNIEISAAKAGPASRALVTKGRAIIRTAITRYPLQILNMKEYFYP